MNTFSQTHLACRLGELSPSGAAGSKCTSSCWLGQSKDSKAAPTCPSRQLLSDKPTPVAVPRLGGPKDNKQTTGTVRQVWHTLTVKRQT